MQEVQFVQSMLQVCEAIQLSRCQYLHLSSQVHDIHPSHAFLVVPDKPARSRSEPELLPPIPLDPSEQCKYFWPYARKYTFNMILQRWHTLELNVLSKWSNKIVVLLQKMMYFISWSCLLDIVGARFHCAICDSVDICSNCESAGLPGNLDSSDDGHNSSHIMIKVHHLKSFTTPY